MSQDEHASRIEALFDGPDLPNGMPRTRIDLSGCDIAILSFSEISRSGRVDATIVDGSLLTGSLRPTRDGGLTDYVAREGTESFGLIGVAFPEGMMVLSVHRDVAPDLSFQAIRKQPSVSNSDFDLWAILLRDPPDAAYVDMVAQQILAYQSEFCRPSS